MKNHHLLRSPRQCVGNSNVYRVYVEEYRRGQVTGAHQVIQCLESVLILRYSQDPAISVFYPDAVHK